MSLASVSDIPSEVWKNEVVVHLSKKTIKGLRSVCKWFLYIVSLVWKPIVGYGDFKTILARSKENGLKDWTFVPYEVTMIFDWCMSSSGILTLFHNPMKKPPESWWINSGVKVLTFPKEVICGGESSFWSTSKTTFDISSIPPSVTELYNFNTLDITLFENLAKSRPFINSIDITILRHHRLFNDFSLLKFPVSLTHLSISDLRYINDRLLTSLPKTLTVLKLGKIGDDEYKRQDKTPGWDDMVTCIGIQSLSTRLVTLSFTNVTIVDSQFEKHIPKTITDISLDKCGLDEPMVLTRLSTKLTSLSLTFIPGNEWFKCMGEDATKEDFSYAIVSRLVNLTSLHLINFTTTDRILSMIPATLESLTLMFCNIVPAYYDLSKRPDLLTWTAKLPPNLKHFCFTDHSEFVFIRFLAEWFFNLPKNLESLDIRYCNTSSISPYILPTSLTLLKLTGGVTGLTINRQLFASVLTDMKIEYVL